MEHQDDHSFKLKQFESRKGFAHWGRHEPADIETLLEVLCDKEDTSPLDLTSGQMLTVYGLIAPKTRVERDDCITTLKLAKETLLRTLVTDSLALDEQLAPDDVSIIKETTRAFKAGNNTSLLDQLTLPALANWQEADIRTLPMSAWAAALESPTAQDFGQRLLSALDWYGAEDIQKTSPVIVAKLLWRAVALDLDADANLCGYEVDQQSNWGKSCSGICADIEQFFITSKKVASSTTASLAAWVLKANYPAGLRVDGVPAQLAYRRSSAWLQLQHGINLAEAISAGASHQMTYQQLLAYPATIAFEASQERLALIASTLAPPLLHWAQANELIGEKPDTGYTATDIEQAFSAFTEHERTLEQAIAQIRQAPPDRLEMTRHKLAERNISPGVLCIDRRGYSDTYIRSHRLAFAQTHPANIVQGYPIFDLLATGRLKGPRPDWMSALVRGHDGDYYPPFIYYRDFPDIPALFEAEFEKWWDETTAAFTTLITALLADLPLEERLAIEQGQVQLCTLRAGNLDLVPQPGISQDMKDLLNTPSNDNALVARHAFLLQSTHGDHRYYHEIFPYAGLIRRRDDLSPLRNVMENRKPATLPFDWKAYSTGTAPDFNAASGVIIHHLRTYGPPEPSQEQQHTFPRSKELARDISRQFGLRHKTTLLNLKRGVTAFDQPSAVVTFLKYYIIPVWGPLEDLIEAANAPRSQLKAVIAALGLAVDLVSLVFPLAKVVGLTTRFVKTTVTLGMRAGLPRLGTLAKGMVVAGHEAFNPLSGAYDALRFMGKLPLRLNRAALAVIETGIKQSRKLLRLASRSNPGPLVLSAQQVRNWKITHADFHVFTVDGQPNVLVFKDEFHSLARAGHYLVDPQTHRPYGARLMQTSDTGTLSRHAPREIEMEYRDKRWILLDDTPELTKQWVRWGDELFLESGGIRYRLVSENGGHGRSVLRRLSQLEDNSRLQIADVRCRIPRGLDLKGCTNNVFKNVNHSGLQARNNQGRNVQPWFTDLSITASSNSGTFVHNRFIWHVQNNQYSKVTKNKLDPSRYKPSVTIEIIGGNEIFKRISMKGGIVEGINDSREISAVVATRKDNGIKVMVTRVDDRTYYKAVLEKGQKELKLDRMQVNLNIRRTDLTEDDYLAHIYNGSFDANAFIKTLSPDVIAADLKKIKADIDAGQTPYLNNTIGGPYDMGTTPEQAALFCKYTRFYFEVVPRTTSPYWKAISAQTPVAARTEIAGELNRLHLSADKFTADNILEPRTTRLMSHQNKNVAYMKVVFKDRQAHPDSVYYATSGLKKADTDLELTHFIDGRRSAEPGWTVSNGIASSPDNVRYINSQRTRMPTGNRLDPDEAIFLPDLKSHSELLPTGNHRMLDTEHMILNTFNKDKINLDEVASIHVFSTKPTCPSCTMGLAGLKSKLSEGKFEVFEGIN